ncbi:DNA (Cytosine-5-)-methyltransferase domain protein [Mycobacterium avium MAV_120809_2495]|nr:DNA (Cytosine-5-)-methyltransferase domain protein [Mycobacterium avium MAV_120809_2495]
MGWCCRRAAAVGYAAQLREFLLSRFRDITLLTFERLVFDGVLQEVVLFCGVVGTGPARIRTVTLAGADALADIDVERLASAPALLHEHEKWTKYFLDPAAIELLRALKASATLTGWRARRGGRGIVTGRNAFFTFTDEQVTALGCAALRALVSRSAQLSG